MDCAGWGFVFVTNFLTVATPRLKTEIFELKGDNKLLRMQLKECSEKLQEQVGYYDDDGNYVERD